jgi:hypothetical protein
MIEKKGIDNEVRKGIGYIWKKKVRNMYHPSFFALERRNKICVGPARFFLSLLSLSSTKQEKWLVSPLFLLPVILSLLNHPNQTSCTGKGN